jgi:hypothetical protein
MLLDSCIGKAVIISSNQGNLDAEVNRFFYYFFLYSKFVPVPLLSQAEYFSTKLQYALDTKLLAMQG